MSRAVVAVIWSVATCALAVPTVQAGEVAGLKTFQAGTLARASEVNANFAAVKAAVDDSHAEIQELLKVVESLQDTVATLSAQLAAVQDSPVMALAPFLSVDATGDVPRVRLTGVNVQVVNGAGRTGSANGAGNLIIGYDEPRISGDSVCSVGTDTAGNPVRDAASCAAQGGTWDLNHKSGSHYLIVGARHNYSGWGGIVAGLQNTSNNGYASVTGGWRNAATGRHASVSGGEQNWASGDDSSVSGGRGNEASGWAASVSGGLANEATGSHSGISGGEGNKATGTSSSVSGGHLNRAEGSHSAVSGGQSRALGGPYSWRAGSLIEAN